MRNFFAKHIGLKPTLLAGCLLFARAGTAQADEAAAPQDTTATMAKVAGRYAHYDIVTYIAKMPMAGEMRSMVISYGFTDLRVEGDQLVEADSFCHSEYVANLPMKSTVDDAFTRAIVPPETKVAVTRENGKWTIYRPFTPTPVGVRLSGPDDPFPTDPNDPRISDDDHDGKPGVTVKVKIFGLPAQIYLARRESFAYTLSIQDNGKLSGFVTDQSLQLVVGASLPMLKQGPSPVQNRDLTLSPILLVPVDASYDCDRLMQERESLFPKNPPL